jgi:hypothetical protein
MISKSTPTSSLATIYLEAVMQPFKSKNVVCTPISNERWGIRTTIPFPSGGEIGLCQPTHPTALCLTKG